MFSDNITYDGVALKRYDKVGDKLVLHFDDHSDVLRHKVEIVRTANKVRGTDYGSRRLKVKITRDITVDTAQAGVQRVKPKIMTLETSIPVGCDANTVEADMRHLLDLLSDFATTIAEMDDGVIAGPTTPIALAMTTGEL
jgi:hypothetical protein